MSGLMLRDHLQPGSKNVNYRVHASGGATLKQVPLTKRLQDGTATTHTDTQSLTLPATVRLTYLNSNAFAHYWDEAVESWVLAGRVDDIRLDETFTIGIAHASHNSNQTTETAFSQVEIRSAEDIYPSMLLPIQLTAGESVLAVGETTQLSVIHADSSETVTFSSLNPEVASVSETGVVSALSLGRATLIATEQAPRTTGSRVRLILPLPSMIRSLSSRWTMSL